MPVEINSRIETILCAAIEIDTPGERAAYIERACGNDSSLRKNVEQLAADYFRAGNFLEPPGSSAVATARQPASEPPGTRIGRYKLLEQIGEGGMGTVYMAEQLEPVRRNVALKIIKPGMDTRQVVARFEAERQALALMDHPNIARVLDAGETESGRPYFVMELVRGLPITDYCDRAKLEPRERLELLVSVCRAVQHAHQKGIIHRDLKPSNVLVTLHDGTAVPKVIDFGVAKAIGQQLTEKTLFTAVAQMVGTPLYMSPEQAELSGLDIDTRSDVYSLGVLAYELLTGHTPFDKDTLRQAGLDELRRMIREVEPPRPSRRVSTLDAEAVSTLTQRRGIDERQLSKVLRGDLDWIVMKCLEKDRNRRYESASALAADIGRHLANEPVEARPPTLADRTAKWARRHRPVVRAAAATLIMATLGSLVCASLIAQAYAREKVQHEAADQAHALAMQQERQARANAARAEQNYQRARAAVKRMLTRVADEEVGAIPEMKDVRRRLLEDAAAFYTELLRLNPRDAVAYRERGDVWLMLARYNEVLADYGKSLELDPGNATLHHHLASLLRMMFPDVAYRDLKRALVHATRAAELDCGNVLYRRTVALILFDMGEYDEAREAIDEAIRVMPETVAGYTLIGRLCRRTGDPEAAVAWFQKAIALDRAAFDQEVVWEYADVLQCLGRKERALAEADHGYDVLIKHPHGAENGSFVDNFTAIAGLYARLGEGDKALAAVSTGIELNPKPNDLRTFYLYDVRGDLYAKRGMYAAALADHDRSIELGPFRSYTYKRRGLAHFHLKDYEKALADIATAVELKADDTSNLWWLPPDLVAKCPSEQLRTGLIELAGKTIELTKRSASAYVARAMLLAAFGQAERAAADFDLAIEREPKNPDCWSSRARFLVARGEWDRALADFSQAVELHPGDACSWYQRALAHVAARRIEEYRRGCAAMLERFVRTENVADAQFAAWTCALAPDATADWPAAIALAEKAAESDSESPDHQTTLGAVLYRAGRVDAGIERLTQSDRLTAARDARDESSPACTWFFLAMAHQRLGRREEAQIWFEKAANWTDKTYAAADRGTAELSWNRRLTLQLLRAEAQSLLASEPATPSEPVTEEVETG